jgi:hypothetical protein
MLHAYEWQAITLLQLALLTAADIKKLMGVL